MKFRLGLENRCGKYLLKVHLCGHTRTNYEKLYLYSRTHGHTHRKKNNIMKISLRATQRLLPRGKNMSYILLLEIVALGVPPIQPHHPRQRGLQNGCCVSMLLGFGFGLVLLLVWRSSGLCLEFICAFDWLELALDRQGWFAL